jgi:hypothetical protein
MVLEHKGKSRLKDEIGVRKETDKGRRESRRQLFQDIYYLEDHRVCDAE